MWVSNKSTSNCKGLSIKEKRKLKSPVHVPLKFFKSISCHNKYMGGLGQIKSENLVIHRESFVEIQSSAFYLYD